MFPLEVQVTSGVRAREGKVVDMDGHMRFELRPGWEGFCADLAGERFGLAASCACLLSCRRWACVVVVSIAAAVVVVVVATASGGVSGTALIVVGITATR